MIIKELCFYGADRSLRAQEDRTPQQLLDEYASDLSMAQYQSLCVILSGAK